MISKFKIQMTGFPTKKGLEDLDFFFSIRTVYSKYAVLPGATLNSDSASRHKPTEFNRHVTTKSNRCLQFFGYADYTS
jgi:hypothetical protein